jgi:hypothetical protein
MSSPAAASPDRPHGGPARYRRLGAGALLAGAVAYIGVVDPHRPGAVFPICPFRLLTGWNCPGCGGLRMTHDVLHGDFVAAINDNVMLLIGLPLLAGWIAWRRHRREVPLTLPAVVTVLITMVAWTVVRNLPGFPLVPSLLTH